MGAEAGSWNAIVDALFTNTLVYLHIRKRYYCTGHSVESLTSKPATCKTKYRDSDLSRLAVMKVACSVFAYKEQFVLASIFVLHVSRDTYA